MGWSFWEKDTWLQQNDIVIIGAGFVGLWTAYKLKIKYPNLKITILEKGIIPAGASTRNAGFSCFGSVSELMHDVTLMGESAMLEVVEMRYHGLKQINETFKAEQIDYNNWGGYELFGKNEQYPITRLKDDIYYLNSLLLNALGVRHTFHETTEKIDEFGFQNIEALAFSPIEGQLHPGKLVKVLQDKVQEKGVYILYNCTVEDFESNTNGVIINTNEIGEVKANQLIICTNAFTKKLLPDLDVEPARGQVFITAPIPGLQIKGTFHYDEGYYYFRNLGNRLLLGGARNKAFEEENTDVFLTTPIVQNALESLMMDTILPAGSKMPEITMRWSGIMGVGAIKQPIIKEVQPNVFCAVRMSGMGVSIAPVVADKVVQLIMK
jgi:glycine/D-amino acid oxidase-like deaminating enzyme